MFPVVSILSFPTNYQLLNKMELLGFRGRTTETRASEMPNHLPDAKAQVTNIKETAKKIPKVQGQARQQPTVSFEKDKHQTAQARWKIGATISSSNRAFTTREAYFRRLLASPRASVASVLNSHFTSDEIKLFEPANPKREPILYTLQQHNIKRYQELLNSNRFRRNPLDLAGKMAMFYYGLPVAPLKFSANDEEMEFPDSEDMGMTDDDDDEGFVSQAPLRDLNSHGERTWGQDELRNKG